MKTFFSFGLVILLLAVLTGCSEPPVPPEVQLALSQEQDLWQAGATVYAPSSYADFLTALKSGREQFSAEQSRLTWFRDYELISTNFRTLIAQGEQIRREIDQNKAQQTNELLIRTTRVTERLRALRDLIKVVKDSRLNTGRLSRIEILLDEAKSFTTNNQPEYALTRLAEAEALLVKTVAVIRPILSQYIDAKQISSWKILVDDVVAESRRHNSYAIVVNKLRRQLILYKKGVVMATYSIGLGFNPIGDKHYAGDRATPEGRYQVINKLPNSKYYRALLINYPNSEDQRRFAEAKRKKLIPANSRIGGLIEIHGGGKDSVTLGCISLNNDKILELFNRIEIGTPVVIVAALSTDNLVRTALGRLE
jgi:hypothetical protein